MQIVQLKGLQKGAGIGHMPLQGDALESGRLRGVGSNGTAQQAACLMALATDKEGRADLRRLDYPRGGNSRRNGLLAPQHRVFRCFCLQFGPIQRPGQCPGPAGPKVKIV